jgi:hypothetical protein
MGQPINVEDLEDILSLPHSSERETSVLTAAFFTDCYHALSEVAPVIALVVASESLGRATGLGSVFGAGMIGFGFFAKDKAHNFLVEKLDGCVPQRFIP